MNVFTALISGIVFGIGLAFSGMLSQAKVRGFLDVFGQWQPDLLGVMGAALITTLSLTPLILKRKKPIIAETFYLPVKKMIDARLLLGAALFGVGWGIYGYCPGPAIAALAYLRLDALLFLFMMFIGMYLTKMIEQK